MKPQLRIDLTTIGSLPFFSRRQAREWGVSDIDLRILLRRGLIIRLDRGWYTDRVASTAEELHVLRTLAALKLHGPEVAAARASAALLHGLPLARADLSTVDLVRSDGTHGRKRQGVRETVADLPVMTVEVPGLERSARVVDIPHAVVGTALTNSRAAALVAGDFALHTGRCTREDIFSAIDTFHGAHGIAAARITFLDLDHRHESPGETLTAIVLRSLRWEFETQKWIKVRGKRFRVDFCLVDHPVAIEFDGEIKYDGDDEEAVRAAQEQREADIRSLGWSFVRIKWSDLDDPSEISRRIEEAIAEVAA
ncbi:hypothetical protein JNO54_06430 [Janibacter sp. YIM B02568]|uniref:type IV toxin-antitoxin system AbiEi family antitoxin domain-containing protein n=1 Tax=Janibacter endophyticus TaxID=2806261 RepID=UPI00194DBEF5|nr:type IV toxin-antitoxin system AbiEi family antitoxin domain-containing protein [Janibacter endophyticus]MBM6545775.1 hypothetical protein [Janibacter endophyticus]